MWLSCYTTSRIASAIALPPCVIGCDPVRVRNAAPERSRRLDRDAAAVQIMTV